ncbi:MAG: hypothetical protein JO287_00320 [Pseudonocardiales bacterium]|nr:hypothetical protein [Pseudonocardiales bacterium]
MTRSRLVASLSVGLVVACCALGASGALAMHKDNPTQVPVGKENPTQVPVGSSEEKGESSSTEAAKNGNAGATSEGTGTESTPTNEGQNEAKPATPVEQQANFTG